MRPTDYLSHAFYKFIKEESGATLIEYVLIASLAAVVSWLFVMAFNKDT